MSDTAQEDCPKCGGSGLVHYDENHCFEQRLWPDSDHCHRHIWYDHQSAGHHSTKCWVCCPHDKGWWLLDENYKDAGKLCCRAGCGTTKDPDGDLGEALK